jgi:hypothetical protein
MAKDTYTNIHIYVHILANGSSLRELLLPYIYPGLPTYDLITLAIVLENSLSTAPGTSKFL